MFNLSINVSIFLCLCLIALWSIPSIRQDALLQRTDDDDAGTHVGVRVPATEQFFSHQRVDHVDPVGPYGGQEWTQRYYSSQTHFGGPGCPLFVILGGEGEIRPTTGLFYPFVTDHLAKIFGAYVLEPEHRFYGKSQPLSVNHHHHELDRNKVGRSGKYQREDPRVQLFTPQQALYDAVTLIDHVRINELGCSPDRFSVQYCPVITVGGSYPGFLSALARIMFPHVVDMAYAASAPMGFYAQAVDRFAYYNHITDVAEMTVPGCALAVKKSLLEVEQDILHSNETDQDAADFLSAAAVGVCQGSIPEYIRNCCNRGRDGGYDGVMVHIDQEEERKQKMVEEVMMVVGYTFANDNMANYPPSAGTRLHQACQTFTSNRLSAAEKVKSFLVQRLSRSTGADAPPEKPASSCWNMTAQLPSGPKATISSGDWSGVGNGPNGESWDFQTCTLLVEAIAFSDDSMFPPREWTLEWLRGHCQARFGVQPQPYELARKYQFDNLVEQNVTRILFTNGLQDGWSVSGVRTNLSDSLLALNFPNGAHHSDLSHAGPTPADTDDIKEGYKSVVTILSTWLDEVRVLR